MKNENPFASMMGEIASLTETENGAVAYRTTSCSSVDLFGTIGALRNEPNGSRLCRMIDGAYNEDKELLAKMLFYARDIRGGLGERDTFRTAIHYCADKYPDIIRPNIRLIPVYGRWDDLFALVGTGLEDEMWAIMKEVYEGDLLALKEGKTNITLLAKWLPSADASSENTRKKGCYTAKRLSTSVYNYKREVKALRRAIDTIESHMSAKDWHTYDYSKVPSVAMTKYASAFQRNDRERYMQYLSDVSKGKAKINASTLYPYDIIRMLNSNDTAVCEELWKALPNYVKGDENFLVMADVSGSMTGQPMYSSIGLAIYFAERNKGPFSNMYMTFSSTPSIIKIPDHYNLREKYKLVMESEWGGSTNLEGAFLLILKVAEMSRARQEDLPRSLIIITDMEFDSATGGSFNSRPPITETFFESMKKLFKEKGYEMPNVVFWNVNSRKDTYHVKEDMPDVQLVSGQSTSTFKHLMDGLHLTPFEMMCEVLSDPRYDPVTVE